MTLIPLPAAAAIAQNVQAALAEDIGACDLTAALIPAERIALATVIAREACVLCGQAWFEACFAQVDARCQIRWQVAEGARVVADTVLCEISGPAQALLTAERCALNFLQTLSAVATVTRQYVDALAGLPTHILDTRKTLPGLRLAQKYAVRVGGGVNQRVGLYDGILIKENHIAAAGSIAAAVAQAHQLLNARGQMVPIQVEVETLDELDQTLAAGITLILLDNMGPDLLREAVRRCTGRQPAIALEASGNVDLHTVRQLAETGVQRISIGGLTKHVRAVDLSMRIQA